MNGVWQFLQVLDAVNSILVYLENAIAVVVSATAKIQRKCVCLYCQPVVQQTLLILNGIYWCWTCPRSFKNHKTTLFFFYYLELDCVWALLLKIINDVYSRSVCLSVCVLLPAHRSSTDILRTTLSPVIITTPSCL